MSHGATAGQLSRATLVRFTLRFWTVAGLAGLLLGATLRVVAAEGRPAWLVPSAGDVPARAYTPGEVALANLSAQVDGARAALARQPRVLDLRSALVGHLLERARFTGSVTDLDEALLRVREAETETPGREQLLLEARTFAALHRFPEALERLDEAEQAGLPAAQVTRERDIIQLALGVTRAEAQPILTRRAQAAARRPRVGTLVDYAAALAAAGRLAEADEQLARAELASPDVSPLPIAYIAFQRGVMAAEQLGDREVGERHYRAALRLVPGFVRASVHLAELEAARGDEAAASERLGALLGAEDPEPASRLAELRSGPERAALRRTAESVYAALLSRHRAAYLDHALEFSLAHEPASSGRAEELARELLSTRPNARAHQLALHAARARHDHAWACRIADAARPLAETHPVLAAELTLVSCP